MCFNDWEMSGELIKAIKEEIVRQLQDSKYRLQGSVSDLRDEISQLKIYLAAELQKIREKLRL